MTGLDAYCREVLETKGPLKYYRVRFSLDKLTPGVDNVRYDVNISASFRERTTRLVSQLMTAEVKALGGFLSDTKISRMDVEWGEFRQGFSEVLLGAVNSAKKIREPQIVSLAQAAITKMSQEIIQSQFGDLIKQYRKQIRKHEISHSHDLGYLFRAKEDLRLLQKNRLHITSRVARELMENILESWERDIQKSYIANFGSDTGVPREFFYNPVLYVNGAIDDFFMLKEYVLLGHRMDDPLRYEALLVSLKQFLTAVLPPTAAGGAAPENGNRPDQTAARNSNPTVMSDSENQDQNLDSVLCFVENIDLLFNYSDSLERLRKKKKEKIPAEEFQRLNDLATAQKELLNGLYIHFQKGGFIEPIMAYYGMQPVLTNYCPPLLPHDVLNFMVSKGERRKVAEKLKRFTSRSGYKIPLRPLLKAARATRRFRKAKRLEYLLVFLRVFVAYHRDFRNFQLISENLQWVNLLDDEKRINLSRVNHTLYELLRPEEQVAESRLIRNHVILKADVRGSTEITAQLSEKRLNPASYFSLNFFDPINDILPEYNAAKVFIEGDALILSIVEKEETPEGWYAVARACGLALNILSIVKRYNEKSRQHQLPVLEQGIGICFLDAPPTYLLDGDNRIMISWAINRADRLSSCNKALRRYLEKKMDTFNLLVFMSSVMSDVSDDAKYMRYNVNGIELDVAAFRKLSQEIDLKQMQLTIPEVSKARIVLYTGIFPTQSGKYQRLIIREALIPRIHPETFRLEGISSEKYYEVCTSSLVYEHVKKLL